MVDPVIDQVVSFGRLVLRNHVTSIVHNGECQTVVLFDKSCNVILVVPGSVLFFDFWPHVLNPVVSSISWDSTVSVTTEVNHSDFASQRIVNELGSLLQDVVLEPVFIVAKVPSIVAIGNMKSLSNVRVIEELQ